MTSCLPVAVLFLLVPACTYAQGFSAPDPKTIESLEKTPVFGTTVVSSTGLVGKIYYLEKGTDRLPNFKKLESKGTVYATRIYIPARKFTEGFPGISNRFEWFAIQYTGKIWVDKPGNYGFATLSDDGSKIYIDGKQVVNNDGQHPPNIEKGTIKLATGIHTIQVAYFQGPGTTLAMMIEVARPGENWRVFDTNDFLPPKDKYEQFTAVEVDEKSGKQMKMK